MVDSQNLYLSLNMLALNVNAYISFSNAFSISKYNCSKHLFSRTFLNALKSILLIGNCSKIRLENLRQVIDSNSFIHILIANFLNVYNTVESCQLQIYTNEFEWLKLKYLIQTKKKRDMNVLCLTLKAITQIMQMLCMMLLNGNESTLDASNS